MPAKKAKKAVKKTAKKKKYFTYTSTTRCRVIAAASRFWEKNHSRAAGNIPGFRGTARLWCETA